MNYKHIDSIYTPKGKIIVVDNAFSFTLPGIKKTCVAKGRCQLITDTLDIGSMDYDLYVGKKKILHLNWFPKDFVLDTSYDKDIDRSATFAGCIRKKTKGWDKRDVKMIIDAFDYTYLLLETYFKENGLNGVPKKK